MLNSPKPSPSYSDQVVWHCFKQFSLTVHQVIKLPLRENFTLVSLSWACLPYQPQKGSLLSHLRHCSSQCPYQMWHSTELGFKEHIERSTIMVLVIAEVNKWLIKKNMLESLKVSFAIIKPAYLKPACTVMLEGNRFGGPTPIDFCLGWVVEPGQLHI